MRARPWRSNERGRPIPPARSRARREDSEARLDVHVRRPTHGSGQHVDDDRDHVTRPARRADAAATASGTSGTHDFATLSAPRGRIPYGYRRVFDTATRRLVSLE